MYRLEVLQIPALAGLDQFGFENSWRQLEATYDK